MTNRTLTALALLLALACWLVWPAMLSAQSAPTGFSRLGTTVMAGTNGVVSQPSNFWMQNVVGAGDIGVDTDPQGRLRIHVMITSNMSVSVQWDSLLNMPPVLQNHAALSNAVTLAASALQTELDPTFSTWLSGDWVDINESIQLAIQQAAQSANLGGDLLTEDGMATVLAVRNVPYAAGTPTTGQAYLMGEDGIMRPGRVAQEGGVTNYVAATGQGSAEAMPPNSVGFTREVRGGVAVLPFYINGTEIGFLSTNGLSLTIGSLNYLNDVFLEAYFRAQDGTVATPAFAFAADTAAGWYRKSVAGGYAWAYAQAGADVALLGSNRLEIATGKLLFLPIGSMLTPCISMLADTGRMGWFSKIDSTTGDRAWAFTHGLYGEIFSITPQGIRLASGKTIYGFSSGTTVSYGTSETNAYRGDWGAAVSNLAANAVHPGSSPSLNTVTVTNRMILPGGTNTLSFDNGRITMGYNPSTSNFTLHSSVPITINNHLLPATNGTYDLGSAARPWRSLYLGGETLYLGGIPISVSTNGVLTFGSTVLGSTNDYASMTNEVDFSSTEAFTNMLARWAALNNSLPNLFQPATWTNAITTNTPLSTNVVFAWAAYSNITYWTYDTNTYALISNNAPVELPPLVISTNLFEFTNFFEFSFSETNYMEW